MDSDSGGGRRIGYGTRLHACLRVLAVLVGRFEPDRFSGEHARILAELFAWGERLCATGKAMAAARVAATGAWEPTGARSAADWLGRVSGQTAGQAATALDTARRLRRQPDIDAAARSGRLSEQQSSAVSAAADKAPERTGELLDTAGSDTLGALREQSRAIQLAADERAEKDRHRAIHARRHLRFWSDDEGAARLTGRLTPDAMAEVRAALAPFQSEATDQARRAGRRERDECHAADALVAMARASLGTPAGGDTSLADTPVGGTSGGDTSLADTPVGGTSGGAAETPAGGSPATGDDIGGADADAPPVPGTSARRPALMIIRVDLSALLRGARTADELCEIDGVGPVAVATARAMMPDSFLAAVIADGVDIRRVVHLGRQVTAQQRTALLLRDPECVVPGCHVRTDLEIDHVEDWTLTRVTRLDALARLCAHHHRRKTYEGWRLCGPPGRWTWTPPPARGGARPAGSTGPPGGVPGGGSSPPRRGPPGGGVGPEPVVAPSPRDPSPRLFG